MITVSVGIIASYTLLAVLLLVMILYSRFSWGIKAAVIVLVTAFYPISYVALVDLLGWPTAEHLPDRFRLIAAQVYEPDKSQGIPGEIYLWVSSLSENAGRVTPRAYKISYSPELHERLEEAGKAMKNGQDIMGEIPGSDQGANGPPMIAADMSRTAAVTKSLDIIFTPFAATVLPTK
ncbi:MAG: hypothetical protein WAN51_02765 [Alphaproteobacteria bacterium]